MNRKIFTSLSIAATMCFSGLTACQTASETKTQPVSATDLHNTVCPVSGDKVADSKLVEVYDGKVYHLCCADCHTDFEKDPAKYETAVAADPAKYGIK